MVNKPSAYFVTGTDTDAGKTWFSCALLAAARQAQYSTAGLKPLAAGGILTAAGLRNDDALALQGLSNPPLTYEQVNACCLERAIAPHIAARAENVLLSAAELAAACRKVLDLKADISVVEGAGGWLVPLNDAETVADLAGQLGLPVILVVGMRLGCLNHALLTVQAIKSSGLSLHGWVANQLQPDMPAYRENLESLRARIQAPLLAELRYRPGEADPYACAGEIELSRFL